MELFSLLDHTVMTTAYYLYSHHRLEQWSDSKKVGFLIYMFIEAGEAWVLAAMTRPCAAPIIMVVAVGVSCHHQLPTSC